MLRKLILLFSCAFWLFSPQHASAATLSEDLNSAIVYAYFKIGAPEANSQDLSFSSFQDQIDELADPENGYHVLSLSDVLSQQAQNDTITPKSVVLTFENFDQDFLSSVWPILKDRNIPFVLVVSSSRLDDAERSGASPNWNDLKTISKSDLAEFGILPYRYTYGHSLSDADLKLDINRAKSSFRDHMGDDPKYFSYPYGDYSPQMAGLVEQQGFQAAFTQASGVLATSTPRYAIPRFTMTEGFADLDRFRMTSLALPFPVNQVKPDHTFITDNPPSLTFTIDDRIPAQDIKQLDCFASGQGGLDKKIDGKIVTIVFPSAFDDSKARVNCTIPFVPEDEDGVKDTDNIRWRWTGFQFIFPE